MQPETTEAPGLTLLIPRSCCEPKTGSFVNEGVVVRVIAGEHKGVTGYVHRMHRDGVVVRTGHPLTWTLYEEGRSLHLDDLSELQRDRMLQVRDLLSDVQDSEDRHSPVHELVDLIWDVLNRELQGYDRPRRLELVR